MDAPDPTGPTTPRKLGPALMSSLILHGLLLACLVALVSYRSDMTERARPPERIDVLYLPDAGAGGGGGGRTNPAPLRKLAVPMPKPEVVQASFEPNPPPIPSLNAPVTTLADVIQASGTMLLAAPDGGGGRGRGVGPGDGPGVGPGANGGSGDGPVGRGPGITDPVLLHEQRPVYTPDAIRMKLQGVVDLDVTVMPDGSVNPRTITVVRSLDRQFGLDEQAVAAAKLWRFVPAVRRATGERVAVRVTIEMTFTLR